MVARAVSVLFEKDPPGIVVRWRIKENDLAQRWLRSLEMSLEHGINERDRIYDFHNQSWTRERICEDMVDCMRKIEKTYPGFFGVWPDPSMDDSITNMMHVAFEELRGESFSPSDMYTNAPFETQMEICRYNLLIHRWESFSRGGRPKITCTFKTNHWQPFETDDYQHFTMDHPYGALLISYAQVGKQLLEVFRDGDDVITAQGIRPMNGFAADFVAKFWSVSITEGEALRSSLMSWYNENEGYLRSLGLHKEDQRLAVGHIQIGDLIEDHDRDRMILAIGRNDHVKDVWIDDI